MKKIILMLTALVPLTAFAEPILDNTYYNKLRQGCRNNSGSMMSDDNCCQASVDQMEQRKAFQLDRVTTVECPEGTRKNMLKCSSTYQWCEPVEIKEPPKAEEKK